MPSGFTASDTLAEMAWGNMQTTLGSDCQRVADIVCDSDALVLVNLEKSHFLPLWSRKAKKIEREMYV